MIYSIFATKDTTLYEATQSLNTGHDAILEISKAGDISGSQLAKNSVYNTRPLIQFNLTSISESVADGTISTNFSAYLNLYTVEVAEVPKEYTLYSYPVSQSWTQGSGRYHNIPKTEEGASWLYKNGKNDGTDWGTGSLAIGVTSSFTSNPGGCAWFTGSSASGSFEATQSFSNESADVRMNITSMVKQWISGSNGGLSNNGLILKRSDSDEQSNVPLGKLMFYSRDTNTIYVPRLEIAWDDVSHSPGSLSELTSEDIILYLKNNKGVYTKDEKVKIRVNGREKYPAKTYATQSATLDVKYLNTSSYYSIRDAHSNEVIVPFDTSYTKISCDSSGNYFNFWMNSLQPERYYRFVFRVDTEGGNVRKIFDNKFIFKVSR